MHSPTKVPEVPTHKISYGQYLAKVCYTVVERPSSTSDTESDCDEDFNRAIALSLATKDENGKNIEDSNSHLENDKQLTKAPQGSVDVEKSPQSPPKQPPLPSTQIKICAGCSGEVGLGECLGFNSTESVWHRECLSCYACKQRISDDDECILDSDFPYHEACYKDLQKCRVCKNDVPINAAGNLVYKEQDFWHDKYCVSHENDGTPRCCSCERMEPVDAKYLNLDDGRNLCLKCLHSSIMATCECEPLYIEIRNFYEGLNMKVEQEFPVLLVERQALNKATEGEKNGPKYISETRGLCLADEQTVIKIVKRPDTSGVQIKDMITEPCPLVSKCKVTAILILYGLPRLLTGTIIAHEMMHAWLRLQGYRNLSLRVEEGICQVLAYMWLDSEVISGSGSNAVSASPSSSSTSSSAGSSKKGERSEFEKILGEFFKYQIKSDPSVEYGDGFRDGYEAVNKHGLRQTLKHIRVTGTFPC